MLVGCLAARNRRANLGAIAARLELTLSRTPGECCWPVALPASSPGAEETPTPGSAAATGSPTPTSRPAAITQTLAAHHTRNKPTIVRPAHIPNRQHSP